MSSLQKAIELQGEILEGGRKFQQIQCLMSIRGHCPGSALVSKSQVPGSGGQGVQEDVVFSGGVSTDRGGGDQGGNQEWGGFNFPLSAE